MKITRIAIILLLGILLASGFACCPVPEATPTPTPTPTPTSTLISITDEWDARDVVWEYLCSLATSYHGENIIAALYPGGTPNPSLFYYYPPGDYWTVQIYWLASVIELYPILEPIFIVRSIYYPLTDSRIYIYTTLWDIKRDGEIIPTNSNAMMLVNELKYH